MTDDDGRWISPRKSFNGKSDNAPDTRSFQLIGCRQLNLSPVALRHVIHPTFVSYRKKNSPQSATF